MFAWVLERLHCSGLLSGKTLGVDATTLEANAALRSIVRRDDATGFEEWLEELARASGIETPNRRRIRGKRLLRRRGENLEREVAHLQETGGLRRVSVRGQQNILKRTLVHAAASNLGLLMRHRHGIGTPRSLQGLAAASMATVGQAVTAVYLSMFLRQGRLVRLVSSIFAPTRPVNRISPLRIAIQRKDHGIAEIGSNAISATGLVGL